MEKWKICAHRGLHDIAPENTMPAFAAAVEAGADEIEFDLWPTADGRLVVCHDPSVDRTTDGKGIICDMTAEQVRNCCMGKKTSDKFADVKIPFFEEVLEQFAGKVVMNIHIKSVGVSFPQKEKMLERGRQLMRVYESNHPVSTDLLKQEPYVIQELEDTECLPYDETTFLSILELIDRYQCRDTVYITGEKDVLVTALKLAPDIKRCCLEGHMNFSIVENAIRYQCSRVQFCKLFLTKDMIKKAHAHGMICNMFWSDELKEAKAFAMEGIDVILTNTLSALSFS